jgi:subtilisin family serine protease
VRGRHLPTAFVSLAVFLLTLTPIVGRAAGAPMRAASPTQAHAVPGEVLVGFRASSSNSQRRNALDEVGAKAKKRLAQINAELVTVTGPSAKAIARLERNPHVRYAEPNYVITADSTPNDPSFPQLWGLDNTGQAIGFFPSTPDADVDAPEAWNVTTGSSNVVVAVLDTGIDLTHPDLAPNIWINPGENCPSCRTDGIDNDGNGYVDDWRGWDFVHGDNTPADENGHGTHVSGTIGAVGNNGLGVVGVNWNVKLMPLRVLDANGSGTTADALNAVLYAAANGATVLNNSYGGDNFSQAFADAVAVADGDGALFVAAAGNDSANRDTSQTYPASYSLTSPNVISVAATDERDALAYFSAYGRQTVALGAPGSDIYSTWLDGGYEFSSGTSMAAPFVAGAVALAKARFPSATGMGLEALLLRTVDPDSSLAGLTRTGGRLNVDHAVRCAGPQALMLKPQSGFVAEAGQPVQVQVIGARCGDPSATTVSVTANGVPIALTNRGDGLYSGVYTPTVEGPVTIQTVAGAAGASDTQTVSGSVPVAIVRGGAPVTVTLANAGDDALLRFSGQAGQRVSLKVGPSCCQAGVAIKNPDGSTLASAIFFTSGGLIDTKTLPQTGTYTIAVDGQGTASGSITLQLYDVPPDATGSIVVGGSPMSTTITTPGQSAVLSFVAQAGQRISLQVSGNTIPGCTSVALVKPSGQSQTSTSVCGAGGWLDTQTLAVAGTYSIVANPSGTGTGSATFQLYDVPQDVTGPIDPGGSPVTVTLTAPGQNAQLSFSGQAGRRVSLKIAASCCQATVAIKNPDGTTLTSAIVSTGGGFIDTKSLAQTGTYTVLVDPATTATGSVTVQLYDVPPDVTGSIVAGGSPVTATVTSPGQNALLSFSGQAGKRVSLRIVASCCQATVAIKNPDGTTLISAIVSTSGGFIDAKTLGQTGTYTVLFDPQSTATGGITLQLYDVPPDVTGPIDAGGSPVTVTMTAPGQNAALSFSGQAGKRVSLRVAASCCQITVTIKNPDGTTLATGIFAGSGGFIDTKSLTQTGTYTVVVDPATTATGGVTLQLYDLPPDVTASIDSSSPVTVTLTTPGQNAAFSFSGQAGQQLTLKFGACCQATVVIKNPDGSTFASTVFGASGGTISGKVLAQSGQYTIVFDPQSTATGSVTVTLTLV